MAKEDVHFTTYLKETLAVLSNGGALLAVADTSGGANVMTIGWGTVGWVWGKPVFLVMVRPSRYTYSFLEDHGEFTVNVPGRELAAAVARCGSASGRDVDKFAECGLTAVPGRRVKVPVIEECVLHYECRVVHRNDVIPAELAPDIDATFYADRSYHRCYYGEILAVYGDPDAGVTLAQAAARH